MPERLEPSREHPQVIKTQVTFVLWLLLWFGVATIWVEGRWVVCALEAGAFTLAATVLLRSRIVPGNWAIFAPLAIAGWGVAQIALHWTLAAGETQSAVLYWLAAACFIGLGVLIEDQEYFLSGLLGFGALMSILALAQLYTSEGKILWVIPTEFHDRVFGTFPYYNNYAAFIELLLPLALWRTLRSRQHWWVYAGLASLMYGSVIASGSRTGTVLATLELAAVLIFTAWHEPRRRLVFVLACVLAFTAAAGYHTLWQRFWTPDPYGMRREFHQSAIAMAQAHPLTGFGLGTWTSAYPAYAVADFGVVANHAHSEWGQWAAEGGWGVVGVMSLLFGLALYRSRQTMWAIGLVAVSLHAVVDYPLVRLGLGCWWFTMLGLCASGGYAPSRARTVRTVRAKI